MPTSRIFAIALLILPWAGPADARLGENQLQHEQR
jgi:hypothetical protein